MRIPIRTLCILFRIPSWVRTPLWALLFVVTLNLGCSSTSKKGERESSEAVLYQKAQDALNSDNYLSAIEVLKKLESQYPYGEYGEQAQLELMYAYFKTSDQMEEVQLTAERFIRLHPNHPKVDYAFYLKGLAIYYQGMGFVERYLNDEAAKRDVRYAQDAFDVFAELLRSHPDSVHVPDARQRMLYLRHYLAIHEIHVARYYLKRHAFVAALNRALHVITMYPKTASARDAMAIAVEAYGYLELKEDQAKMLAALRLNAPDHPQLTSEGEFVASGYVDQDRASFWSLVTFGLVD